MQLAAQPPDFFSAQQLTASFESHSSDYSKVCSVEAFRRYQFDRAARIEFICVYNNLQLNPLLIYFAAGFSPAAQIQRPKGKCSGVQISPSAREMKSRESETDFPWLPRRR
jgi:hypothetical protein